MKKQAFTLILALLLLGQAVLTSCSEGTENAETTAAAPSAAEETVTEVVEEETEMTRENTPDDLPELDYEGSNTMVLARTKAWFTGEMFVEELNGEIVNDAVYERDLSVEERLNVVIDYTLADSTNTLINNNVTAGNDEFQIHVGSAVDTVQYGVNGNYYNLLGEYPEYLNLEQPWWSQYYTRQGSIMGCSFFATGDLFTSLTKLSFVTYANMQMITDYGFGSPYEMVREGTWTFDNMMGMATQVYVDENGNGAKDPKDTFGYSLGGEIGLDVYWSAFDLTICQKDENDVPAFSVDIDKMSSVIEKLYPYYMDNPAVYVTGNGGSDAEQDVIAQMLADDRMMFSPLRIMHTEQIRDMESAYALLPLPKWDETQQDFCNTMHAYGTSYFCIPTTVADADMSGAVLEALSYYGKENITPAYYDTTLKGKYFRDEESAELLDLIFASRFFDVGTYYQLGGYNEKVITMMQQGDTDFASMYTKNEKAANKVLGKINDAYAAMIAGENP